jgi:prophage regulatory protein
MSKRFICVKDVVKKTCLSKSEIYQRIKIGHFPRPIALGPRKVVFLECDIEGWMQARMVEANRLGLEAQRPVGHILGVLAGPEARSKREYLGEGLNRRQHRGFWLPPLEECRRRWEKYVGRPVAWPDTTTSWTDASPLEDSVDAPF